MYIKKYPADKKALPDILADVREFNQNQKLNRRTMLEYEHLAEELLVKLMDASNASQELSIRFHKGLTGAKMVFLCNGDSVDLEGREDDFGAKIIQDYSERISYIRKHGTNQISVITETSSDSRTKKIVIFGVFAILTCLLLSFLFSTEQRNWIHQQVTGSIVLIFIKLMQNLAVPIAFVSLVTYIINFHDSIEFDRQMKRVSSRFFLTSVIATLIPFALVFLFSKGRLSSFGVGLVDVTRINTETVHVLGDSLEETLGNILPDNLIEIFTIDNPIPMLLVAILLSIGINSYSGESNTRIRNGVNALRDLLAKIIDFIFSIMPFFFYVSVVDVFLRDFNMHDMKVILMNCSRSIGLILLAFLLQLLLYAILLVVGKIPLKPFFFKYKDMLWENFKIGSNLDALPYNIRAFRNKLRNREQEPFVRNVLRMGANINMDGNCLIITTTILIMSSMLDFKVDWLFLIEMICIILLLGIGSPNQPGSFTIAMLVLMRFLGIPSVFYPLLIIMEGIFCKVYSTMNAFGDIVTVVIVSDSEWKTKEGEG